MRCKKCGKRIKNKDYFCTECGYYNGDFNEDDFDIENNSLLEDININSFKELNASGEKENQFYYENEALLEAYIGEDYKIIKKWPFNIWAFLFNWMYFLYRKLYITGIIGLGITFFMIMVIKTNLIIYLLVTMLIIGFIFNYYYIFVSKRKVEKIISQMEGTDKFTLANICKEKGGVNVPIALIIYGIFLCLVLFSLITIKVNKNNNTKFWEENSKNKANCQAFLKLAYNDAVTRELGTVQEGTCKITNNGKKQYEIIIKTKMNNASYYASYKTDNSNFFYVTDTKKIISLQRKKEESELSKEDSLELQKLKTIEINYKNIKEKAKKEDEEIKQKKDTEEKNNFIFTKEEIIR